MLEQPVAIRVGVIDADALGGAFLTRGVGDGCADQAGAVLAKIAVLVFIIVFIQKRPQGLFALKGRALEA